MVLFDSCVCYNTIKQAIDILYNWNLDDLYGSLCYQYIAYTAGEVQQMVNFTTCTCVYIVVYKWNLSGQFLLLPVGLYEIRNFLIGYFTACDIWSKVMSLPTHHWFTAQKVLHHKTSQLRSQKSCRHSQGKLQGVTSRVYTTVMKIPFNNTVQGFDMNRKALLLSSMLKKTMTVNVLSTMHHLKTNLCQDCSMQKPQCNYLL